MKTKQRQILEVAEALFAVRGFDATSTRAIAEGSGVNIAMLSYYFGSKEGVFEALLEWRGQDLDKSIDQLIDYRLEPAKNLSRYLQVSTEFYTTRHPAFLALMVRESSCSQHTVLSEMVARHTVQHRDILRGILENGGQRLFRVADANLGFRLMLGTLAAAGAWPSLGGPSGGEREGSIIDLLSSLFLVSPAPLAAGPSVVKDRKSYVQTLPMPATKPEPVDTFEIGMID